MYGARGRREDIQVVPILGGRSREDSTLGREGEGGNMEDGRYGGEFGRLRWEGSYMEIWIKRWGKKGRG